MKIKPTDDLIAFQTLARSTEDRMVFANAGKDGGIGTLRNSAGSRRILWLRDKFFGRKSQREDIAGVYDRFSASIAASQRTPDANEMKRVEALLADDRRASKPLTSYRIRAVLSALDPQRPGYVLQDRFVARHCTSPEHLEEAIVRGMAARPELSALQDPQRMVTAQDREALSERIHARLMAEDEIREDGLTPEAAEHVVHEEVEQLLQDCERGLRELSPNALADTRAVHTAGGEIGAILARAEAALDSIADSPSSGAERAKVGSDLHAAQRVLMLMHHKVADLEATLRANGELHGAKAGLVHGMHDMLAARHQRIADLASEYDLDLPASAAFARDLEATSEAGKDAGANVYDRSSVVLDPAAISEAEVHGIMPHLLSHWNSQTSEKRSVSDVQFGDIVRAKQAFFETQHELQAQGRGLTENEIRQLDTYIDQADINRFLGPSLGDPSRLPGRYRRQFDGMQSGLAKLPDEQAIVYRGTTTSRATIDRFRDSVGERFVATAFLSTSAAPNFAKAFPSRIRNQAATDCEVRFQILGRSGKNISGIPELREDLDDPDFGALAAGPESSATSLGNGEILFSPGSTFRLVAFAKHPQQDVYGMVLKEEPRTEGPVRNLQDAGAMATAADGLASELAQVWDDRMESR